MNNLHVHVTAAVAVAMTLTWQSAQAVEKSDEKAVERQRGDAEESEGATRTSDKTGDTFESWGLGVAAAVEFFDEEYIETANIQGDNRLVVVEKATKSQPAVWAVGNWTLDQCLWRCEWIRPCRF